MSTTSSASPALRIAAFLQIVLATVLGFAATDLVLPAIPALPQALAGTAEQAQHVLAAFVAGFAAGLLLFGELGARWPQRGVLTASLVLFGFASLAAGAAGSMPQLVALRFVQGVTGAAAAAFAPGILRRLFEGPQAMRAIGVHGSIESLVPALAPVAGAWLLAHGSWRSSFTVLGVLGLVVAAGTRLVPPAAFPPPGQGRGGSYLALLRNREVTRHGLGQACSLAGMLVLVFAAPAVFVTAWGGTLADFIRFQVMGVACFIGGAQASPWACRRFGEERVILIGASACAAGCAAILLYALADGRSPMAVTLLWMLVNAGFGLRGPPGFLRAIVSAGGDDSRAAALVILAVLLGTALGTIAVAPWITSGLVPPALGATVIASASVAVLLLLRKRTAEPAS
jgi:MFS family permease